MKKKILFLIHALNAGGAQTVLLELVNRMDPERFDVTVQTVYDRGELRSRLHPTVRYRTVLPSTHPRIQALKSFFLRRIASPKWGYRHYVEDDYDVAVAFLEGECTRLISGCRNPKTKRIAWVHADFRVLFSSDGVYRSTEEHWNTYRGYDRIVCVSQGVADGFCERFRVSPPDSLTVRYNVVDAERIRTLAARLPEQPLPSSPFRIVAVGNVRKEKGYDRLLRVCRRLAEDGLEFRLTVIGGGSEFDSIRKLRDELGLGSRVDLMGNQSNPYCFMKQADLFLSASYSEGFSTVLIESVILNIPAMATDCAGTAEILDGGKYGMIVPNSEEGLYENLKKVIADPGILAEYRAKLPERVAFFDPEKTTDAILELFD